MLNIVLDGCMFLIIATGFIVCYILHNDCRKLYFCIYEQLHLLLLIELMNVYLYDYTKEIVLYN